MIFSGIDNDTVHKSQPAISNRSVVICYLLENCPLCSKQCLIFHINCVRGSWWGGAPSCQKLSSGLRTQNCISNFFWRCFSQGGEMKIERNFWNFREKKIGCSLVYFFLRNYSHKREETLHFAGEERLQWMVIWAVIWWHFDSCLQLAHN